MRYIAALYQIEADAKGLDPPEGQALRQHRARPILDAFQQWITQTSANALPNSGLAKALAHTRKRWPALVRYADNGALPIDNNPIERSIRPIAIGRKNWLCVSRRRSHEGDMTLAA